MPAIILKYQHQEILKKLLNRRNSSQWIAQRSEIILRLASGRPIKQVAWEVGVSQSMVCRWLRRWIENSCFLEDSTSLEGKVLTMEERIESILRDNSPSGRQTEFEYEKYREAVFSILHSPPSSYNINRATWRIVDIKRVMKEKELPISKSYISNIIKNEGFRFRKAKKVLTSTDPNYKEKLQKIKKILANLKPMEKFFSIDEYGPFAIKLHGGKSWML